MRLSYFQFLPLSDFLHLKSANIKIVSSIFSFINPELLNQAEYTTPSPKAPAKQKRTTDRSRWFLSPGGTGAFRDFTSQAPASFQSALVGACLLQTLPGTSTANWNLLLQQTGNGQFVLHKYVSAFTIISCISRNSVKFIASFNSIHLISLTSTACMVVSIDLL